MLYECSVSLVLHVLIMCEIDQSLDHSNISEVLKKNTISFCKSHAIKYNAYRVFYIVIACMVIFIIIYFNYKLVHKCRNHYLILLSRIYYMTFLICIYLYINVSVKPNSFIQRLKKIF